MNKLSLAEFRKIKENLLRIVDKISEAIDSGSFDGGEELMNEYSSQLNELLSFDLSDIPFEEWKDMYLFTEGELDFSKTHANIDFSLLRELEFGSINLNGCHVKRLELIKYDDSMFEPEFIRNHPEYFPDESLPSDVKKLFYDRELEFSTLASYPSLKKCANEHFFRRYSASYDLIKVIGFQNAIKFFEDYPDFIISVTDVDRTIDGWDRSYRFDFADFSSSIDSYDAAREFVYSKIISQVRSAYGKNFPPLKVIPQDMIDRHPEVFIKHDNLPDDVFENYYKGLLGVDEIRKFRDALKDKDLDIATRANYQSLKIKKVFGDYWTYFDSVPEICESVVLSYLNSVYDDSVLEKLASKNVSDIIADSITQAFGNPQYVDDCSLEKLYAFSKYVSLDVIFRDPVLLDFIQKCGFENIYEFNQLNDGVLEFGEFYHGAKLLKEFSVHSNLIIGNISSVEELTKAFGNIFHQMRLADRYSSTLILGELKSKLVNIYPDDFLDYNLLDELLKNFNAEERKRLVKGLEEGFNGNTDLLLEILNRLPFLLPAVKGKNLIINEYDLKLQEFYQAIGNERFLDICTKYGKGLSQIFSMIQEQSLTDFIGMASSDDYESKINKFLYDLLLQRRSFDIRTLPSSFKRTYPELFLDENAPKNLQDVFYNISLLGNTAFLSINDICKHPDWLPFLKNVDLSRCLGEMITVPVLKEIYDAVGKERFLDICLKYGRVLNNIVNFIDKREIVNFIAGIKSEDYESQINQYIYKFFGKIGVDIRLLPPSFGEEYPELFLSDDIPKEVQDVFYGRVIWSCDSYLLSCIRTHPNWINFFKTIDLAKKMELMGYTGTRLRKLYEKVGKERFLDICLKYGESIIQVYRFLNDANFSKFILSLCEDDYETVLNKYIYDSLAKKRMFDIRILPPSFKRAYPKLFLGENAPQELLEVFYGKNATDSELTLLSMEDIHTNPSWIPFLKNIDLGRCLSDLRNSEMLRLYEKVGNVVFLDICLKYGMTLPGFIYSTTNDMLNLEFSKFIFEINSYNYEEIIKKYIYDAFISGRVFFDSSFAVDMRKLPKSFIDTYPDLFLDENAPQDLVMAFYGGSFDYVMSFSELQAHKEWLPFLKGKQIAPLLVRDSRFKHAMASYFRLFGVETGIKLGISRAETVNEMIASNRIDLMKEWYDRTGGKFIPDVVVMNNFSLEEADKFLSSGFNWSKLMRIKSFANSMEARDAMLKLAYSFGAFDYDQKGFKKLIDLLTTLPKRIDVSNGYVIGQIDEQIDTYSLRGTFFHSALKAGSEELDEAYDQMIEHLTNSNFSEYDGLFDGKLVIELFESLRKEMVDIDFSRPLFSQFYGLNEDGSFSLRINPQSYPNSTQVIRKILEHFDDLSLLTPNKAHQLFGAFELRYDPDFRDFLLANMDKVLSDPKYVGYISSIQKRFSEIKTANSNRTLTLDLALSFVQENTYASVNVGNAGVAVVSSIAGYTQADFNVLQRIYNYGKQRTFSSIPRITGTRGSYSYEILRLDDPLAMAVGTLTGCCQEINNCAEVCMEHSMVDKNGRVFVVKDNQGNVVAQSWVWRNGNVLCFDNVEIPDKAFVRAARSNLAMGRKEFSDEVYRIYRQAAHELIEEDERIYRGLLESGEITLEQYESLRLGKVTVGLGYNDIARSIKENSPVDSGRISRPLPFTEPVLLSNGLYTRDSTIQHILEERKDRPLSDGNTLFVHSDSYVEYSDSNFSEKMLSSLVQLERITKNNPYYLLSAVNDYADPKHLVTEIANNYGLNAETTRIILHPNFAIIYDVCGNVVRIGDLFYNIHVDNGPQQLDIKDSVLIQIKLALDQISGGRAIDVSELSDEQLAVYEQAIGLDEELDVERGINRAK